MKLTPSQVKNFIDRGLRLLADPEPAAPEQTRAFDYFGGQCAYCGKKTLREAGDLDHLVASSKLGRNHISNRVPSCRPCNAIEKREMDWEVFLKIKCAEENPAIFKARKLKIEEWLKLHGESPVISESMRNLIEAESRRVRDEFQKACEKIRGVRRGMRK